MRVVKQQKGDTSGVIKSTMTLTVFKSGAMTWSRIPSKPQTLRGSALRLSPGEAQLPQPERNTLPDRMPNTNFWSLAERMRRNGIVISKTCLTFLLYLIISEREKTL